MSFKDWLGDTYETDPVDWAEGMAQLIKENRMKEMDYDNLENMLLEMSRSEKREVFSRLGTLIFHLLRKQLQLDILYKNV